MFERLGDVWEAGEMFGRLGRCLGGWGDVREAGVMFGRLG